MSKYVPHGTTVTIGGDDIGGVIAIPTPAREKGEAEMTDNDSGGDREWSPGLRDNGSLDIEFRTDPEDTGQVALKDNFEADSSEEIVITAPSDSASTSPVTWTFDAFVQNFQWVTDGDQTADDSATGSATLRVDGSVTFDTGS